MSACFVYKIAVNFFLQDFFGDICLNFNAFEAFSRFCFGLEYK